MGETLAGMKNEIHFGGKTWRKQSTWGNKAQVGGQY